jgi:hypothetical protein
MGVYVVLLCCAVYVVLLLPQVSDHRKQVARLEITFWPEHTHEILAPDY